MLLTLGMLGLTVELWTPGATLPGVAGGLCLLLAFFALQILPVSTTGLLLMVFGVALLILEVKVPSFGALGVGGAISLFMGSVMFTRQVPGVQVSLGAIIPAVLVIAAAGMMLGRLVFKAQRLPSVMGTDAMIGQQGLARTPLEMDIPGHVEVRGEFWRAVSERRVEVNQPVRILAVKDMTLVVEPLEARDAS